MIPASFRLSVQGDDTRGWCVFVRELGTVDISLLGAGPTREEAVKSAVACCEAFVETLQQPYEPPVLKAKPSRRTTAERGA